MFTYTQFLYKVNMSTNDMNEQSPSSKRRRRNHEYYVRNKDVRKTQKNSYLFKMEVAKEHENTLIQIRSKLDIIKDKLKASSAKSITNVDVMEALIDCWLKENATESDENGLLSNPLTLLQNPKLLCPDEIQIPHVPPEFVNPKFQLHSPCKEKDEIYLVCKTSLNRLVQRLLKNGNICKCGERYDLSTMKIKRVTKCNHCVKVSFGCKKRHTVEWFSSTIMSL